MLFRSPTIRLFPLPWPDAIADRLPIEHLREHDAMPWMHRPLDVAGAVAGRGWPTAARGDVTFRLVDPLIPENDGGWRLELDGGEGRLSAYDGDPGPVLDTRAWAVLWCGVGRAAQLRSSGRLSGDAGSDDRLDALLGCGAPVGLLDYF